MIKHDLIFSGIRNEERFQKIVQRVEAKYLAEHERVRKWLEEQGMYKNTVWELKKQKAPVYVRGPKLHLIDNFISSFFRHKLLC